MFLRKNLQEALDRKLKQLNKKRPLSPSIAQKLRERFEVEMTYNSNAIEGNTLTLKETYWVIQQGITVKDKPLKDHLEAKSHKEALDFLYDLIEHKKKFTVSEHLIKTLHSIILKDIDKEIAGVYRKTDVFIAGSDHKPPSALKVLEKMNGLVSWAKKNYKKLNIIEFSALFHHKFVQIHPFQDGNGRAGRLLMNIFLMQYGFPLTIIQNNDRKKYYRVLSLADQGKFKPLTNFIAQSILRSLTIYLDAIIPASQKEDLITLADATKYCSYSQAYLGKLAKEGRLEAVKLKRNWMTTKEAVKRYLDSQKKHASGKIGRKKK